MLYDIEMIWRKNTAAYDSVNAFLTYAKEHFKAGWPLITVITKALQQRCRAFYRGKDLLLGWQKVFSERKLFMMI